MGISRKGWMRLLKIAVSSGLLLYLFLTIDVSELGRRLVEVRLVWFGSALALMLVARLIVAVRWQVLLAARGVRMTVLRSLQLGFIGSFFNTFLPTSVGGDAVRALHVARSEAGLADSFVSVVLERAVGMVALVLLTTVGCIVAYDRVRGTGALTGVVILWILIVGSALVFYTWGVWSNWLNGFGAGRPRLAALLGRFDSLHESILGFRRGNRELAIGFVLSVLFHALTIIIALILAKSLGIDIPFIYFVVFQPLRQALMMIPITIFGTGVREASSVLFYTQVGMTHPEALAFGLVSGIAMLIMNAVGGIVYALSPGPRCPASAGESAHLSSEV